MSHLEHTVRSPTNPFGSSGPPLIGVFDSGVGGLSVLKALRLQLPQACFIYLSDSGHAPYGERSDDYVLERSRRIAHHLFEKMGCQGIVIACNTATAIAVQHLRDNWPGRPLVGVEPGLKPAASQSIHRRIGVMATAATLRHARFQALVRAHAASAEVTAQACPGLALAIEQGDLDAPDIKRLLAQYCGQLREKQVDTVVLGCTHYAFVLDRIGALLGPGVRIVETADAVARQAARLFGQMSGQQIVPEVDAPFRPHIQLQTTGSARNLQEITLRWLGLDLQATKLSIGKPASG